MLDPGRVMHPERRVAERRAQDRRRQDASMHLARIASQAPVAVALLQGPQHTFELANPAYRRLVGGREVVGKTVRDALPDLAGQGFYELLDRVYASGETHTETRARIRMDRGRGVLEDAYLDFVYQPLRSGDGAIYGIGVVAYEVTELVQATRALEATTRAAEAGERRIAAILASISDAFFALDATWCFTYLNDRATELLGRPREALLGREIWTEFPEALGTAFEESYRSARERGQPVAFEAYFPPLKAWYRVSAYPSPDGLSVYFQDITAQRRAAEDRERLVAERDAERERLKTVLEQSPMGIIIAEAPSGRMLLLNRQANEIFGRVELAQEIGEYTERFTGFHADGRRLQPRDWPLARAIEFGETVHDEVVEIARTDGAHRTISINAAPVLDQAGSIVAGVAIFSDVTAQRRAEQELREAREAAEAANQAKSDFLATMSHEFRTPLNAFAGYLQLLEMGIPGPVTEGQREYLARLHTSSQHLLGLVNDVLDLSKIDAGRMAVRHENVNAGPVLAGAVALVAPQAAARGVRVAEMPPAELRGLAFIGDEDRVRQVLVNLLSNAVKFTNAGGTVSLEAGIVEQPQAPARLEGAGPWAFVRVRDTGIGIAEDQHLAIFEPFHQAQSGHTRQHGGTGLGLAISRRLARLMNGDLCLERSAPGEGAVFALWLPAARLTATGEFEHAGARSSRASIRTTRLPFRSLGEIGAALREATPRILARYVDRVRRDPAIPLASEMRQSLVEDHAMTLLADLAQSLVILGDAGPAAADLLRDGSEVQRMLAERHGMRRFAQGWSDAANRRDVRLLREAIGETLRERATGVEGELADALSVLDRLIERIEEASVSAWKKCEMANSR
jgi:PAS domain S-box-containing protein